MLSRPDISSVLAHPYFWDSEKRLSFLQDVSDYLETLRNEQSRKLLENLDKMGNRFLCGPWDAQLDGCFTDTYGRRSRYDVMSLQDLLRMMRNNVRGPS